MASNFFSKTGKALLHAFKKNWVVMLLSAVFAVIFWGYVIAGLNLPREKNVTNIPISLVGTQDLQSRNLIVIGMDKETASAVIKAEINQHSSINASRTECRVNLDIIKGPGIYDLPIDASVQSGLGTVVSTNPAYVRVEVDELHEREIPVRLKTTGEVPEGYAVQEQSLLNSLVTVRGAARYLEPIYSAEAIVDLSDRTEDISGAVVLIFYNEEGEEIEVITANGQAPTVIANIRIRGYRELPIYINAQEPDGTLFVTEKTPSQETVIVYGNPAELAELTQVETERFEIASEITSDTITVVSLVAPENTALKTTKISVTTSVSERMYEQTFTVVAEIRNLSRGMQAINFDGTVSVLVRGNKEQMEDLTEDMIIAVVDTEGLSVGSHEVIVAIEPISKRKELVFTVTPTALTLRLQPG